MAFGVVASPPYAAPAKPYEEKIHRALDQLISACGLKRGKRNRARSHVMAYIEISVVISEANPGTLVIRKSWGSIAGKAVDALLADEIASIVSRAKKN
jgi:hypothetical protein